MFSKLTWRNVARSFRDYAIYFITLMFGVCLFYVFNSLSGQSVIQFLGEKSSYGIVETIFALVNVFSGLVTVVLAGLILYANNFLMKRRKRELGTYFLLGMSTGKVARMLVFETLLIGLAALASGIVLGIFASWCLDKLTLAMFLADMSTLLTFRVSIAAILKTALYFGIIFLLVMLFTGVSVSRSKLIDLIRGGRKNEEITQRPLGVSVFLFLLGCVLLGIAYAMLLINGLLYIDPTFFLMLALGSLGTFLIFRSLSGFLLRLTEGHVGYYKGLNMFVLRQWSAKVHTNCVSNTVICILLLLAIGVTACSIGLNDTINTTTTNLAPYDATLLNYGRDGAYEEADINALLRAGGLEPEDYFSNVENVTVYYNDRAVTGLDSSQAYAVVLLSDYNKVMKNRGLEMLDLAGDVSSYEPTFTPNPIVNGPSANGILVVPDAMLDSLEPRRQMVNITYRKDAPEADDALREAIEKPNFSGGLHIEGNFRLDDYFDLMGSKILALYMGLYLGLVFLLTAAAVLALQQLSQAADNAARYQLLARLGAPKTMRLRAILSQVGFAFLLPLALGVVHAIVGMTAANEIISSIGKVDSVRSSVVTAVCLIVIYGGYFLATCFGSWQAVRNTGEQRQS